MWKLEKGVFTIDSATEVDAPVPLVYDVISDVTKYPEFINDVPNATLDGDICTMTMRVGPMKIPVKTRVENVPLVSTQWTMVEGPMKSLVGRWSMEGDDNHTTISLHATVEAGPLGQWMMRMVGKMADREIQKLEAAYRNRIMQLKEAQVSG